MDNTGIQIAINKHNYNGFESNTNCNDQFLRMVSNIFHPSGHGLLDC